MLRLPASDVVRLLRAEMEAAHGQPELNMIISKEHVIAEEFDRRAYHPHDGERFDLVTAVSALTIEPRVEHDYWVLSVTIAHPLGPLRLRAESRLERKEMTLNEFEAELRSAAPRSIVVRLTCETTTAKRHFDH